MRADSIFIFGGYVTARLSSVESLNLQNAGGGWATSPNAMPAALNAMAAAYAPTAGRVYVYGGCTGAGTCVNTVWSFNPTDHTWVTETAPVRMSAIRSAMPAVFIDGQC
jgi:hypothetical protein